MGYYREKVRLSNTVNIPLFRKSTVIVNNMHYANIRYAISFAYWSLLHVSLHTILYIYWGTVNIPKPKLRITFLLGHTQNRIRHVSLVSVSMGWSVWYRCMARKWDSWFHLCVILVGTSLYQLRWLMNHSFLFTIFYISWIYSWAPTKSYHILSSCSGPL